MTYEGNPKYKHPWQSGRRGSLCPSDVSTAVAQALLDDSTPSGLARFAVHEERAFCAREHRPGAWHGYPVSYREVPPVIREQWLKDGRVSRSSLRRNW